MLRHRFLVFCLSCAWVTCPLIAQSVDVVQLETPEARFAEAFSRIAGLRELPDGRVLVSDMLEVAVRLVDFARGTMADVGRQGSGPGEYGMPGALFAARGDTTYLLDMGNRRFLRLTAGGVVGEAVTMDRAARGLVLIPRAIDAGGRVYVDLSGLLMRGMENYAASGRAPLLRLDPHSGAGDTVAYLQFAPLVPRDAAMPPGEVRVTMGPSKPYEARDAWAVDSDGRVAVVRAEPYRVEWYLPDGTSVVGPAVRYQPVRIGRAEKEAWVERMGQGIAVVVENGVRRTMRPPKPDIESLEWPEAMPPFDGAPVVAPWGEVWVRRSRPARERRAVYDVFDGRARLVRQVVFPDGRRLIGFGQRSVYAVHVDADDLQWLERYPRPEHR
ncbi:MAG: hypothetical protein KatS3mg081_2143 [Gemmatimonadales bacterium]|nr:MAG: hypothetical protein KatS3mg081_2143 [Gemmatimonadales bacterium]